MSASDPSNTPRKGHPGHERMLEAMLGRVEAGEPLAEVMQDYGYTHIATPGDFVHRAALDNAEADKAHLKELLGERDAELAKAKRSLDSVHGVCDEYEKRLRHAEPALEKATEALEESFVYMQRQLGTNGEFAPEKDRKMFARVSTSLAAIRSEVGS